VIRRRDIIVGMCLMASIPASLHWAATSSASSQDPSDAEALKDLDAAASTLDFNLLARARDTFRRLSASPEANPQNFFQWARADYYLASYYELLAKNRKAFAQAVDAAIHHAERAVEMEPNDSDAHALLGDLYGRKIGLGGFFTGLKYGPKGINQIHEALKLNPHNAYAYDCMGRRYLFAPRAFGGDIQKAVENFRKAVDINPNYDEGFVWLGIGYEVQGNVEQARQEFERALKINPLNAHARFELSKAHNGKEAF
jgi:tetratricopeptide (TPR) repeat protein